MRVLYVIDSLDRPGGAEQALASMAPGLVSRRGRPARRLARPNATVCSPT